MDILKSISLYFKKYGFSPTVREIGDMVGLKSTSTVHRHLELLRGESKIQWNEDRVRTIRVLPTNLGNF